MKKIYAFLCFIIICPMFFVEYPCLYGKAKDYDEKQDIISPAFAKKIADAKCLSFFGDKELFDVENDPHEINNLVDSPDVDHRRVLKQLRRELTHWIEETNDQGVESESPAVIDHWVGDAARRHGTPDWYDEGFGASSN
jgi:hypothetical protein